MTVMEGQSVPTVGRVEAIPLRHALPPEQSYGSARGRVSAREGTLVRLETDDGVVGWGEAFGPPAAVCALVDDLAPLVVGAPVNHVSPVVHTALQVGYHRSHGGLHVCALSGVETAMWDAWGRYLGLSVSELLGGRVRSEVPAYASTGFVTEFVDDEGAFSAALQEAVGEGFSAAKIKVGLGRDRDRRRAEIAREKLGERGHLMVDFNSNYTADTACRVLDGLRDLDIDWAEEPVPPHDHAGYARVRRCGIPIAAGEAAYTRVDFRPLVADQLVDIVQPDLIKCGGIGEARTIVDLAQAWNLRVSPHVWGGAIGQAASLQLLAAIPNSPHTEIAGEPLWLELDRSPNELRWRLLTDPIIASDGVVAIPSGPGLGVCVDEDVVAELRVRDPE
ncbi:mandelate racemase/muconate lactonizing enzyme family protein [Egibacter rhizosphaerae]|uniref:Mandelate racemase/muconate lactonizing enzyme family protein n=1 Tax=Egibacter rhizosphaerae TaxID=1670831 RepID=A0A411YHW1_9ACTN|nr:mandelate racemase/muconate lactonizing enzyme family protein [Egibacter rhizosphaerae]QBI20807.1 mandelate racemase/muconate lactonizing enzyme family protein [Egibacter rhizosphaerae]